MSEPQKTYRKIWAIPDVHGRLDLLKKGLDLIHKDGFDPAQDLMVFLGDMIDRGPNSNEVLEEIKALCWLEIAKAIRGNHDDFAVDVYVRNLNTSIWEYNGRASTEASYPDGKMTEEHYRWLATLPLSLEIQGFFFSHAPVPREKARTGHQGFDKFYGSKGQPYNKWELTWHYFGPECERKGGMMDMHEGPLSNGGVGPDHLIGVCGHIQRGGWYTQPSELEVRIFPNYRMLDSGSGYPWGRLAVHECISDRTFYADQA